jgi:hypothetical protein
MTSVGADDDGTHFIRSYHFRAHLAQCTKHIVARMPVLVDGAYRNYSDGGVDRSEKGVTTARRAAVMPDFENICR